MTINGYRVSFWRDVSHAFVSGGDGWGRRPLGKTEGLREGHSQKLGDLQPWPQAESRMLGAGWWS